WQRWAELRGAGFRKPSDVAAVILPSGRGVRHVTINQSDARVLSAHLRGRVSWLPNLTERGDLPAARKVQAARRWLASRVNSRRAPIWILPCRFLRRKNIAEAILIARWLRPEAWLVTTGGISSEDEAAYGWRLTAAVARHRWPVRLSLLA